MYSDNAPELIDGVKQLDRRIRHVTSREYANQTSQLPSAKSVPFSKVLAQILFSQDCPKSFGRLQRSTMLWR